MEFDRKKPWLDLLFQALILFSIFLLSACGNTTQSGTDAGTGTLTFKVAYLGTGDGNLRQAAVMDCDGLGVATVEAAVYDSDSVFLVSGGPWECNAGQGTIGAVEGGSGRTIVIWGKNTAGNVVMRGQQSGINVVAGSRNDAGTIGCQGFVPNLRTPAEGAVVNTNAMGISWDEVAGATQYQVIVSENSDLSAPTIDTIVTTTNFTPTDLSNTHTYHWQIVAKDSEDNNGIGSNIWSFTLDRGHGNIAPVAQIISPVQDYAVTVGDTITFTGSGNDNEDGTLTDASLVWRSGIDGQIGTGATFTSVALTIGTHQITLTATDAEGATGTSTVTISVNEKTQNTAPLSLITCPSAYGTYATSDVIAFTGSGTDGEDGDLSGPSLVWQSNVDGQIGTGISFMSGTLSAGTHEITLTVTDSETATGVDTVTLTIDSDTGSSHLPDTGQTVSHTDTFGEDADYIANTQHYTKLDSSGNDLQACAAQWTMVRDDVSGLTWEVKTDDGGIHDKDDEYTWQASQDQFIDQLNRDRFGTYSDWRLPTLKELFTLANRGTTDPSINTAYFPNTTTSFYWTGTTFVSAGSLDQAFYVYFSRGSVHGTDKLGDHYVRAVRGSQRSNFLEDNGNGTVTDTETGLIWQQAETSAMTWEQAIAYCENLELAGHSDWRLPNINELQSLTDNSRHSPALNKTVFPDADSVVYWSSTPYAGSGPNAWYMSSRHGVVNNLRVTNTYFVRAVRAGR